MKFSALAVLTAVVAANLVAGDDSHGHSDCTHGRIFLSDASTSDVHVMDLDEMEIIDAAKFTVPGGGTGQILTTTDTPGVIGIVAAIYRGTEENRYTDGSVHFYTSGFEFEFHVDHYDLLEGNPVHLSSASIDCARPIHFVPHDKKIAIFCDGFFSEAGSMAEQVNTTVWLLDESTITSTTVNPIILKETLQGSHHGVAIPIDDDHLLISRATPERINRDAGVSSLPDGFTVQDYQGNLVHSLNQDGDRARSCPGYHGSAAQDSTFALACDSTHGGIVMVDYANSAYTSYAIDYPASLTGVRTGTFAEHPLSNIIVGNLNSPDKTFLLAFDPKAPQQIDMFESRHLLEIGITPCSFQFEKGTAEHLLVWMPNGMLNVYEVESKWNLVDSIEVVPGMTQCSSAFLVAGYGHAVVVEGQKLHSVELIELYHQDEVGPLGVETLTLDFIPRSAIIAGAYVQSEACQVEEQEEPPVPALCFPGDSMVSVKIGESVEQRSMNTLEVGDLVEVAEQKFEPIYSFGHRNFADKHDFLRIRTDENQVLMISTHHMIFSQDTFVAARDLRVGDTLTTTAGETAFIQLIEHAVGNGAFAPFTPSGKLIVDGILVSSFAAVTNKSSFQVVFAGSVSMHTIAHAFEFPHRLLCHYTAGFCPREEYTSKGLSMWAHSGWEFAQWTMGQNDVARNIILFFLFGGLSLFAVADFVVLNLLEVAAFVLIVRVVSGCSTIKISKSKTA